MAIRWTSVLFSFVLGVTLLIPGAGRAQGAAVPARGLTAEQLDSFVELTGDPKPLVWQRLLADPGLVPFAAAAANARLERRASGKTMTIVGFTILGVGAGAGYGLLFWGLTQSMNCDYASSCKPNESLMLGGLALMIASIATGCAIGIPGIIRMVRPSEAETEASSRYQTPGLPPMPAYPPSYSQASWLRMAGRPISAPILSLTF